MKILRIFIKGPHVRWVDIKSPDNFNILGWAKAAEQQGYIMGETMMVMRDCIEAMAIFEGAAPENNITPLRPVS